MRKTEILGCLVLLLVGCAHQPSFSPSQGHIDANQEARAAGAASDIPKPVKSGIYLPPPKPKAKEQTYSVVVNDVPVREILFALARESKLNVDVHPGISGNVTLNAVDQTLPAILERISKQVDLTYKLEGNVLSITPDMPTLRTYKVNYVNMDRDTTSSIGVAAQIASTGSAATGTTTTTTSGTTGNSSLTTVNSKSKNSFWDSLADNVRIILKTTKTQTATAEERAARAEAIRASQEDRLKQVEAVSRAGAGAEKLFQEAFRSQQPTSFESRDEVIINPVAGTFTVMATERQHGFIQQYVDTVMASAQRQVLIEATIVEVTLNDTYRLGVDWSRIGNGFTFHQLLSGAPIAAANPLAPGQLSNNQFVAGYSSNNIKASVNMLQTFGNARVLSSPKLMTLNNQTSILKAVDNLVYFTVESTVVPGNTNTNSTVSSTSTPHTVPVGVVMSVTPQISDAGRVILIVRPTISRSVGAGVRDPVNLTSVIPQIQVREMESVLQVESGQTVVLGGLMQDVRDNTNNSVPEVSKIPFIGKLFQSNDDTTQKTELVIFLRPTVIPKASLESDELKSLKQYLPNLQSSATANEPAY